VRASEIAPFGYADVAARSARHGIAPPTRRWTVTRMRHRYGTELRDDLTLRQASPLTLTRRWRWPQLRTSARAGESAFHVQYVVEHTGCADTVSQRRQARRWATAESMWEARHDLWPGQVILDPITSLGIEPGSSAPAGWPPPPAPPPAPPNTARAQPTAPTTAAGAAPTTGPLIAPDETPFGAGSAAPATPTAPEIPPTAPPAASTDASWWSCATSGTSRAVPLTLALAALLFATRRRRRR
jgi:MYXO-CTERM domain-containing protein